MSAKKETGKPVSNRRLVTLIAVRAGRHAHHRRCGHHVRRVREEDGHRRHLGRVRGRRRALRSRHLGRHDRHRSEPVPFQHD